MCIMYHNTIFLDPITHFYASVGGAPEAYGSRRVCVCVSGADGTVQNLDSGLDWTGLKNGLENGRDQFAGVGVACNGSFAAWSLQ